MRGWKFLAALGLAVLGATPAALAAEDEADTKLNWFGSLRIRPEYNDNLTDTSGGRDDKIGYVSYRTNLGLKADVSNDVSIVVDLQAYGRAGENQTPLAGGPSESFSSSDVTLYRGYVEARNVFGEKLDIRLGRQEVVLGNEWLLGNNDFYGGLVHDALAMNFGHKRGTLVALWTKIADTDSPEAIAETSDVGGDFDLYALYDTMQFGEKTQLDLGVIYTLDHRYFGQGGPHYTEKRFTYTAYFAYGGPTGPWAQVNAALQDGVTVVDVDEAFSKEDINASAYEATGGWGWDKDGKAVKAWVRLAGYTGDDSGTDTVETFSPLVQDFHNRYGLIDFWNGYWGRNAYIGGPAGFAAAQLGFQSEVGNGITLGGIFQRLWRDQELSSISTNRNMGQEFGLTAAYDYGKNVRLEFGYGQLYPGTAIKNEEPYFAQSVVRRVYVNATARF